MISDLGIEASPHAQVPRGAHLPLAGLAPPAGLVLLCPHSSIPSPKLSTGDISGSCGRPAVTWPALPVCEVAEPLLCSSLGLLRCTRELLPGTEEEHQPVPGRAELVLWQLPFPRQTCCLSPRQGPFESPHFPCGDKPVPCWLSVTVLPPCPGQSSESSCGHVPAPSPVGICPTHEDKGASDAIGSGLVPALAPSRSRHTRTAFMAGVCQTSR